MEWELMNLCKMTYQQTIAENNDYLYVSEHINMYISTNICKTDVHIQVYIAHYLKDRLS